MKSLMMIIKKVSLLDSLFLKVKNRILMKKAKSLL